MLIKVAPVFVQEVMKGAGLGHSAGQLWSLHLLAFLHGPLLAWKALGSWELSVVGPLPPEETPCVEHVVCGNEAWRQELTGTQPSGDTAVPWAGFPILRHQFTT